MGPGNETLAGQVPNLFQEPDGHLQQEEGKEQPRECVCVCGGGQGSVPAMQCEVLSGSLQEMFSRHRVQE